MAEKADLVEAEVTEEKCSLRSTQTMTAEQITIVEDVVKTLRC